MKQNWPSIHKWCLIHEGGFVNHPQDPGGATNKGVTQRVYDAYRRGLGRPAQAVREITDAEVDAIYRNQYWDRVQGDLLPSGVDYAVYDYAVNSGVARAAKELQRILDVSADGVIGQITLAALGDADAEQVIRQICENRIAFMKRIKNRQTGARLWDHFGKGWSRRVMGNKDGFQASDIGVIDRSIMLARAQSEVSMSLAGLRNDASALLERAQSDIPEPPAVKDSAGAKAEGDPTLTERLKAAAKDKVAQTGAGAVAGGLALPSLLQPPAIYVAGGVLVLAILAVAYLVAKDKVDL